MTRHGVLIEKVAAGSPAEEMGLEPGDRGMDLNGHPLRDFLDFQYYLEPDLENILLVRKPDGEMWEVDFELDEGEPIGIEWGAIKPRTCCSNCVFCFVDQLPPQVRPSLLIKDEDYRHSFLFGNFITLGNFTQRDLDRVLEQRLSPLYISVHTTDPELRKTLLGCPARGRFFDHLTAMIDGGITLHTQIVLCPDLNDGEALDKTITDLARHFPAVASIGVVPVGLTRYRDTLPVIRHPDLQFRRAAISQVEQYQKRFRREFGVNLVYLADEFYLQAGQPLPPAEAYDDFPQLENGIGMVRDFLTEFAAALESGHPPFEVTHASFVTGQLFAPVLEDLLDKFNTAYHTSLRTVAVPNRFLGDSVTVAGLLSGSDIVRLGESAFSGDFVAVPYNCISRSHGVFLDDMSLEELATSISRPVHHLAPGIDGFLASLSGEARLINPIR